VWRLLLEHCFDLSARAAMDPFGGPVLFPVQGFRHFTEIVRTVWDDTTVSVERSSYGARSAPIGSLVCVRI
jgi:hypothetical protein